MLQIYKSIILLLYIHNYISHIVDNSAREELKVNALLKEYGEVRQESRIYTRYCRLFV